MSNVSTVSRIVLSLSFIAASALLVSSAHASPWYAREGCVDGAKLIFGADLDAAAAMQAVLVKGDPDDKACSVWLGVTLSEMRIALLGRTEENIEFRSKQLDRMFGFSKHYGKTAGRFADIELEARSRRVRVLLDIGDRGGALAEARRAKKMLDKRPARAPSTATYEFVRGGLGLAVSSASWPLRTVLRVVGLGGDGDEGKKAFEKLWASETVYKYDSMYSARHFATERPDGPLGKPSQYSKRLYERFTGNHQFVFDYADDLRRDERCKDALEHLAPTAAALDATPQVYSSGIRARVYWLIGRCARTLEDLPRAKAYAKRARAENYPPVEERLSDLEGDL